jgi:hypothetical protein
MEDEQKTKWTGTAKTYPRRVMLYENDEGIGLLEAIARRRGIPVAAALRQLIREEAKREEVTLEKDQ